MRTSRLSLIPSAAAFAAILMSGVADRAVAQTPKPPPPKAGMHEHGHAGMSGMNDMMGGPHHTLAMAYRDNLATFARALQDQVAKSKTVDLDLARPAVTEMRRSFESIQQHHQAHKAMMGAADSTMLRMMQHMDSSMAAAGEHLTALEAELNGSAPDPGKVTAHTTAILKLCAGTPGMHGEAKPHHM
jgi:hypothetical protein